MPLADKASHLYLSAGPQKMTPLRNACMLDLKFSTLSVTHMGIRTMQDGVPIFFSGLLLEILHTQNMQRNIMHLHTAQTHRQAQVKK